MKNISPKKLNDLIVSDKVIIIDAREPFEHKSYHIKGAILIPSSKFDETKIPYSDNKTIVIHCKSGRRSSLILSKMKNKNCHNLEGGIEAWIAEGFDIVKSNSKHLPLDRQVQLTIGTMLVMFTLLTYFININFAIIPFIIGCGLSFAGITGLCGLAMLLAKAPWNKVALNNKEIRSCNIEMNSCCN